MSESKLGKPVLVLSTKGDKLDNRKLDAEALRETARGLERMTEPLRAAAAGMQRMAEPWRGAGALAALEDHFKSLGGFACVLEAARFTWPRLTDSLPAKYRHHPQNDEEAAAAFLALALEAGLRVDEFWKMPIGDLRLLLEMRARMFPEAPVASTAPAETPATTLGEQLRAARKVAGHNQAEAAHEIGVDTKTVSGVESERHTALRNKNAASFRGYIAKYSKSPQTPS